MRLEQKPPTKMKWSRVLPPALVGVLLTIGAAVAMNTTDQFVLRELPLHVGGGFNAQTLCPCQSGVQRVPRTPQSHRQNPLQGQRRHKGHLRNRDQVDPRSDPSRRGDERSHSRKLPALPRCDHIHRCHAEQEVLYGLPPSRAPHSKNPRSKKERSRCVKPKPRSSFWPLAWLWH